MPSRPPLQRTGRWWQLDDVLKYYLIPNDAGCSTIFDEDLDTDDLKLLDRGIDFGDNNWLLGAPVGWASV